MQISIRHNIKQEERRLNRAQRSVIPKATTRAINKTIRKANTVGVRQLSKDSGLKQASIRRRFRLKRAHPGRLQAEVVMTEKRPPNLGSYRATQLKKGVKASAWGQRKLYRKAFVLRIRGNDLVFTRRHKGRGGLKALWGPSLAKMFQGGQGSTTRREMERTSMREFPAVLKREVRHLTRRMR